MKISRHRALLTLIFVVFSLCIAYSQNFGLNINNKKGKAIIPFEHLNNLIVFQISVNGGDSLSFILDTGVKNTILLSREIADSLKLVKSRSIKIRGTGNLEDINAFVVPDITIGACDLSGKIYSLIVLEDDSLHLEELFGREIHGIIGHEIFARFIVKINYDASEIILYEKTSFKLRRSYSQIPINIINSKPYINCKMTSDNNIVEGKFMLDVGASHACLVEIGKQNKITLPNNHIECKLGRGLAGGFYGYKSRIQKLEIGEFIFKSPIISYTENYTRDDTIISNKRSGTIGGEIFSRFNIIFDYNRNLIYVKKNRKFRDRFEHNLSGIDLVVKGIQLNVFVINHIRSGSAADKTGLMEGDFIYSINGNLTRLMKMDEINSIFHSRHGRKIRLQVIRNGEVLKYSFKLQRDI